MRVLGHRRDTVAALLLVFALLAAACNSTARVSSGSNSSGAGGLASAGNGNESTNGGSNGAGNATGSDTSGGVLGAGGSGADAGSGGAGGAATGGALGTGGSAGGTGTSAGKAPGGAPLKIGIRVADKTTMQAMATALGARGISGGDPHAYAQALVDWLNATGGVAGRRVDADILEIDLTGLVANSDASDQQSCDHFTLDVKVFSVLTPIPTGGVLPPCLAKRGVPLIIQTTEEYDEQMLRENAGYLYLPGLPNLTRQQQIIVDGLDKESFYKGAKLGIVWYDKPEFERAVNQSLKPALAAHGVKIADEVVLSSYTDSQQFSAAVLRFKAKGITHVQFVDVSGLLAIQFMQYAESQQFRPRYGLSSANSLGGVTASAPAAQLRGALGVGWMPSLDVPASKEGTPTPAARLCLDILRKAGQRTDDRVAETIARWTCETVFFFRTAMSKAPQVSPAGLRAGVDALGATYAPASTFASRFAPNRYDGPSVARHLAYDAGCSCFGYTSGPYDIG